MAKAIERDINRGYVQFIKSISSISEFQERRIIRSLVRFSFHLGGNLAKLGFLPLLYVYGVFLILWIRCRFPFISKRQSSLLHRKALHYVPDLISQYPMHLYPIVTKSLEMAFIKEKLEKITQNVRGGIVELAIGDGTFSGRIFSEQNKIMGLDLNPYSLIQTKKYPHVANRIVADCLNPPIESGGASFVMSNNFLHHITNKEETLERWSSIARYAVFNENTNYWSEGWWKPYLLKWVGFKKAARRVADQIANGSLQTLWKKTELSTLVRTFYEVQEEETFCHEKVFFLSSICSALLFCYGPPTPKLQKRMMKGILFPITKRLSYHMAKALIEYDAILPRDRDVFICWALESKRVRGNFIGDRITLVCPDCFGQLRENHCQCCQRSFEEKDGMLFLLPKNLAKEICFRPEKANVLGEEHL